MGLKSEWLTETSPAGWRDVGNAESALNCSWQCLGTWGDLGDASPSTGRAGGTEHGTGVQRACGSLWVREVGCLLTLAATELYWKIFLFQVHLMGQSVVHVALHPDTDLPLPWQLRGLGCPRQHGSYGWALAATRLRPLLLSSPPSQAQATAITGHRALCLERREKVCCLLWKAFTTPFVIADHTQRTIFVSFSLIPTQIFFQGWY